MNGSAGRRATYVLAFILLAIGALAAIGLLFYRQPDRTGRVASPPPAKRPTQAEPGELRPSRALSLRNLQIQVKARQAVSLGELNTISGLVLDQQGDVLLLGESDPSLPPLPVDDLAVALRHAYQVDPVYQGDPGCTIDPREGVADPFQIQVVKVFGIPRNSRMAAHFVGLDYELKKVSAGIKRLNPDLRSLWELHRLQSPFCRGEQREKVVMTHRFWFCADVPESPRYWENESTVWIRKPVHVRLMAEQEFLASTGEKRGKADPDPAASEFAREVSRLLRTNDFTPYVELRNQFRLIELAAVLCFKKVPADRFAYLLDEHRLSQAEVPEYIGEIRREERGEVVCETQVATQTTATGRSLKSNSRLQVYHYQSRGGVEAKVQVQSADFARAETGDALVKRVLTSRPSEHSLTWTITY